MTARGGSRATPALLGAACLASFALLLWLNRSTTFFVDELVWFSDLAWPHDIASILHPHNSHLIGTARLVFLAVAEVFGTDYVVIRVIAALSVALCAVLFYAWARRRIGSAWALLPAVLLLFYGSAWQHVVNPIGFTITFSIAAGLAALLTLERGDRRGDVLACAFVTLSVFTYTVGLGYLVAVAVLVLLGRDRLRRAWIPLIPLALYGGWWVWAQQFDQGRTSADNAGHVVSFFAKSLAVDGGALTGVAIPFSRFGELAPVATAPPGPLGWMVAVLIVAFVARRLWSGCYSPTIFGSVAVVATYWLAAAIADPLLLGSQVDQVRYVLPGSVGVLLVLTDAAKGMRIRGAAAVALVVVFVFSLAMNLVFLRDGAHSIRAKAVATRTVLAMVELANGSPPGAATADLEGISPQIPADINVLRGTTPGDYLTAAARYGSPAFDLAQIRALPAVDRLRADAALRQADAIALRPAAAPTAAARCRRIAPGAAPLPVAAGELRLRAGGAGASVALIRFGDPPGVPQALPASGWSALTIRPDPAPEPWRVVATEAPVTLCEGRSAG